jgi:uncharacterized membrane protein
VDWRNLLGQPGCCYGAHRVASLCIALLMIAVFPANIYFAGQTVHGLYMPTVPVRLLMQVIYIVLVLTPSWGLPVLRRQ